MAKLKEVSNLTGRLGNAVYVRLKSGQTILRSLPRVNPGKRSPAQLRNQERFRLIHQFCARFKQELIPQIWNDYSKTDNGYNLFIKANTPAFGPGGELTDLAKIRLSTGTVPLPVELTAQLEADGSRMIKVSWQKGTHQGGTTLQDELIIVSAGDGAFSAVESTGLKRKSLGGSFKLPEQPQAVSHLFLFFASADRKHYSESVAFKVGE